MKNIWYFILPLFLLIALLARNPFSERNLISNFEPFPDTFHYVTTSRCFLSGEGWTICREGRKISPAVPPLYGISLLPFLLVLTDARVFYFANVFFLLASFGLLVLIFRKLKIPDWVQLLSLGLFVTTYQIYWFPSLAMAENLLIPLVLIAVYLLLEKKLTPFQIVLAGFVTTGVYATKYSALGIVPILAICFLYKIWTQYKKRQTKIKFSLLFLSIAGIIFLIADRFQLVNIVLPLVQSWFAPQAGGESTEVGNTASWWLSPQFFVNNLIFYLKGIVGESVPVLWERKPLFPWLLSWFTLLTSVFSLYHKQTRIFALTLLALIILPVVPLSFFYAPNFRYILYIVPLLVILLSLNITTLSKLATPAWLKILVIFLFISFTGITFIQRLQPVKYQLLLNAKYAETPWWYLSVKQTEEYFTAHSNNSPERRVLITAISPFLYDYFQRSEVQLLPLSLDHDFRQNRQELWGEYEYSNLIDLYSTFLDDGRELYVMNYGIGNEIPRQQDWQRIQENFELELIQEGCFGSCNLWKLSELPVQ